MRLHADFSKRALVIPNDGDWVHSPESGVDRLMLDRIGEEVARATSIVRYAAGSEFPRHEHALGEEFLVLEGTFSDESGDYPPGSYVRNPPGSGHAPFSHGGCRILVKLRQFDPDDLLPVVVDTADATLWSQEDDGSEVLPLHEYGAERVEMRRFDTGGTWILAAGPGGAELLVTAGSLMFEETALIGESWLRLPAGDHAELVASEPTTIWLKSGHLPS